jgi:hypothetical protein
MKSGYASRESSDLASLLDLLDFLFRTQAKEASTHDDFPFAGARLIIQQCRFLVAAEGSRNPEESVMDNLIEPCADILKSTINE